MVQEFQRQDCCGRLDSRLFISASPQVEFTLHRLGPRPCIDFRKAVEQENLWFLAKTIVPESSMELVSG